MVCVVVAPVVRAFPKYGVRPARLADERVIIVRGFIGIHFALLAHAECPSTDETRATCFFSVKTLLSLEPQYFLFLGSESARIVLILVHVFTIRRLLQLEKLLHLRLHRFIHFNQWRLRASETFAGQLLGRVNARLTAGCFHLKKSGEFDFEFAAQGERGAFEELQGDGGVVVGKEAVNGRARGFHTSGERGPGNPAAFHFFRDLPGHDAFERAGFAFRKQVFLREKVVEVRADVPVFHKIKVSCAAGSLPVPNLRAASSAIF